MKGFWVLKGIKILILIVFFVVLMGSVVMWLWNWLMPTLFNLPLISLEQAVGLTVMCRILAGGIRFGAAQAKNIGNKNVKCGKNGQPCRPKNGLVGRKIGAVAARNIVVKWASNATRMIAK